ncbi:hypothetical protein [Rufibacter tibetensis]|uniref:Uncharacterized protein n=1 Tax=Rufibacter tibetensis TaxID=512763 RepID=A0A0P0C371_9BACT|nr:hypothetical protein [Rufibacter tibetensis]ALI99175.1 hypothetical protein DC20_09545 [Rufibacter tibetensis]
MKLTTILILFFLSYSATAQIDQQQAYVKGYINDHIKSLGIESIDSTTNIKVYRIWTDYQLVHLEQKADSTFNGLLVNFVTKRSGTPKKPKEELIIHSIKIPDSSVMHLLDSFYEFNIETLKDSHELENYPQGLDGNTFVFEVANANSYRIYSYWEPLNDRYQNKELPEIISVRGILKTLISTISPPKHFAWFLDKLPKGSYRYGGINMVKF